MYSPEIHDDLILGLYRKGNSSTKVAVELGLTCTQYKNIRENNDAFNNICEFGENLSQTILERIALRGAKGKIKNFNNTILQFLLKAQYPATYNDKKDDKDEGGTLLEKLMAGSLELVKK